MRHDEGPFLVRLPREPGRRESRYAHLFCGEVEMTETAAPAKGQSYAPSDRERLEQLEEIVAELREVLEELRQKVGE
jgi:uncharacterized protein YceH (UPF0502 family)